MKSEEVIHSAGWTLLIGGPVIILLRSELAVDGILTMLSGGLLVTMYRQQKIRRQINTR